MFDAILSSRAFFYEKRDGIVCQAPRCSERPGITRICSFIQEKCVYHEPTPLQQQDHCTPGKVTTTVLAGRQDPFEMTREDALTVGRTGTKPNGCMNWSHFKLPMFVNTNTSVVVYPPLQDLCGQVCIKRRYCICSLAVILV